MPGGRLKQLIYYGAEDIRLTGTAFMRIRTPEEELIFQEKRKHEEIIQREKDELYELEHKPLNMLEKIGGCAVLGTVVIFGLFHGVPPPFFGGQRIPRRKRTEREISEIILKDSLIIT